MLGIDLTERRTELFGQTVGQIFALGITSEMFEGHDGNQDGRHLSSAALPAPRQDPSEHDKHEADHPHRPLP